jgi:predicted nucleic acid-binding protein
VVPEEVVADANVLLSAVIGKAANKIFSEFGLRVHVAEFNAREVEQYLPMMAEKYKLPKDLVQLQWRILPIIMHTPSRYTRYYKKAVKDLKERDPEDAHALALARALKLPLWSNDHHLEKMGLLVFTTAKLLRLLENRK